MALTVFLATEAQTTLGNLAARDARKHRRVVAALAKLGNDPRYPGLQSHRCEVLAGPHGEELWESYVENKAPSAWRVWWFYAPDASTITVVRIGPHPSSRERAR